ncbi:oxygen-independent coproporphyrinogen-3 oxidase [Solimonas aquatica]|uniref:Heme chaperone HemW n=1 Tax=Solimonas aquatica TaxID=489703 RepID=A0A1H9J5X5_9GAMM|nr:radical SAM family heme chaperone HemW [Solimonas aquatica]SEQ82213.1 oxygen-independent coproporphyrinogen-3 oxidase [Solimonas aquatica]
MSLPASGPRAEALPLSLYLHFPWCVQKCPYCDFNSHGLRETLPEEAYVDALLRDLDYELSQAPEARPLVSIFMGGGTPSLFSERAIGRLLEAVARRLRFAPDIEITLEANPGTAEAARFAGYAAAGINRLSIGVQSLDDAMLKRLGRIHDSAEVRRAVDMARAAGIANFNLDLMFALPEQTPAQALGDLRAAIALQPTHLSYYQLTLEPNTEFAARPPPLPDEDSAWQMQEQAQSLLAGAGYAQYEVSAYAQEGRRARHNLNYWQFGDYLGIGAGAHGKRSLAEGVQRRARHKHPKTYLAQAGGPGAIQEQRTVGAQDLPFEFLMNALRLNAGFAIADYEARTGLRWAALAPAQTAQARGLIEESQGRVRPTALGHRHLNGLLQLFL